MSIPRQPARLASYSITHPPGRVSLPTQPGWDRLVYTSAGLFTARTDAHAWTIPAHRALTVPDGTPLSVDTARRTRIRCLYLDATLGILGHAPRVLTLHPLLAELVDHAVRTAPSDLSAPVDDALVVLLASQLSSASDAALRIPLPGDPAARELADSLLASPATGLEDHVRAVGASRRTLERRFRDDTGLSLGRWRRRARMLRAVALLGTGLNVTQVAVEVGYASPSSFVAAFRAELDVPPGAFIDRVARSRSTPATSGSHSTGGPW